MTVCVIPYVDQPLAFWEGIRDRFGPAIAGVYFPMPGGRFASGRSPQPLSLIHISEPTRPY